MQEFNILDLIISLIITITVYSLPIIIVRYAVIRHPIKREKAKFICIIYAVLGLVIMAFLIYWITDGYGKVSGGGLLLWSYVNYKMLTTGKDRRKTAVVLLQDTDSGNSAEACDIPPISAKPQKTIKKVYCKQCGGRIDCKTKKCTSCGKQYFKFSWKVFSVVVLCLALTCVTIISISQHIKIVDLMDKNTNLQSTLDRTEKNLRLNKDSLKSTIAERNEYREIVNWFDKNAVFVTREGNKYHHYWCKHLKDREYWIYNIEYAEYLGYQPCLDCCYP